MSPCTPSFSEVWEPRCAKNLIHPSLRNANQRAVRTRAQANDFMPLQLSSRMGHPGGGGGW